VVDLDSDPIKGPGSGQDVGREHMVKFEADFVPG